MTNFIDDEDGNSYLVLLVPLHGIDGGLRNGCNEGINDCFKDDFGVAGWLLLSTNFCFSGSSFRFGIIGGNDVMWFVDECGCCFADVLLVVPLEIVDKSCVQLNWN